MHAKAPVSSEFGPLIEGLREWFSSRGVPADSAQLWSGLLILAGALVLGLLLQVAARTLIRSHVAAWVQRSSSGLDDLLHERKVFSRLAGVLPGALLYLVAPLALAGHDTLQEILRRSALIYVVVVAVQTLRALLEVINDHYRKLPNVGMPITGYVQMATIVILVGAGVLILAIALDQSPLYFLSGLGALSAVLMLVFKDSLLGLVASVQLAANDMVRIGDWIEAPKYGADGEVIEITLTTVKVMNWDKTMSLLPAYALVSDAFRNWRSMTEAGGRRIKRSIPIDMNSVHRCDYDELERYEGIGLLKDDIIERTSELRRENEAKGFGDDHPVNGKRLTNLGLFRLYVQRYLESESRVRKDFTFMVRQLEPTVQGLPLEIYVFTMTTEWKSYEAVQADIFDHLLSVAHFFGLRLVQTPGSEDVRHVGSAIERLGPALSPGR